MYKDGCSAFILSGDKILLFLRDNVSTIPFPNCWSFPGGQMEEGETPQETVTRELQEEVTYVPKNLTPLGFTDNKNNKVYIFMARVSKEEEALFKHVPGEGQKIGFYKVDEVKNMKLTPGLKYYADKYEDVFLKIINENYSPTARDFDLEPFN